MSEKMWGDEPFWGLGYEWDPDWVLTVPERDHALVNFALPEVRAYFRDVIGDLIRRLDLRWLKWDFNMDPLPCWQAADDGGLAHLGHVDGVWETFDWIRSTFPDLVLENCASGGNRLDFRRQAPGAH